MMDEQATDEAWREVGRQFRVLGESLAQAFRAACADEGNRQHMLDLQAGLEAMVEKVGRAVDKAGASPAGQRARVETERAVESARAAGGQAWQDARPHVISALRQVSAELQKMATRLEEE